MAEEWGTAWRPWVAADTTGQTLMVGERVEYGLRTRHRVVS
jgi:hypothetical protein